MHRLISRLVPLFALSLFVSGCGGSNNDPVAPPPPPSVISNFSGTLTLNGAATYSFTVTAPGGINAQLTSLQPDSAKPVGFSLGTWNGSICQIVLRNDASIQGSLVVGSASAAGDFCVSIYDAAGNVVQPQTYVIDVEHG
jgi:hypothetical protein